MCATMNELPRAAQEHLQEPMPALEMRLFGAMDVRMEGRPLRAVRSRKVQWLLALLVLKRDRPVERSWLASVLWPESAEEQALASLRKSLNDLRNALGPQSTRLA